MQFITSNQIRKNYYTNAMIRFKAMGLHSILKESPVLMRERVTKGCKIYKIEIFCNHSFGDSHTATAMTKTTSLETKVNKTSFLK